MCARENHNPVPDVVRLTKAEHLAYNENKIGRKFKLSMWPKCSKMFDINHHIGISL